MSKSHEKKDISQGELTEYVYDKGIQLVMCTRPRLFESRLK